MTIQHASDVPDGQIPVRRTLAEWEFVLQEDGRFPTFVLPDTPVVVDAHGSLVFHSAYTPSNYGLSILVKYYTPKGEMHVFTALATFNRATYFAFRLPTGQFIELYLERDYEPLAKGA